MNLNKIKLLLNNRVEEVLSKLDIKYEIFDDNIYSTCPVHESSDNPRAFSFSKKRGIWKCWTRECQHQYKNDIFGLIRGSLCNANGSEVTFSETLEWIKKEFDIQSIVEKEEVEKVESEFEQIVNIFSERVSLPQPKEVKLDLNISIPSKYFIGRGFNKETLEYFEIGDCVDKNSKLYERSIIPIHNDSGSKIIGYIGRSIREYKTPKFLIYPKGFDKRFVFYNMHRAIESINKEHSVFIVEGQGDVWKLYEAGIHNVIGMFGKTLSKEQQVKLQQLPITNIIILTDNDQAGRESKIQLQRQLGRFYNLKFPKLNHKDIGDMSADQIRKDIISQVRG